MTDNTQDQGELAMDPFALMTETFVAASTFYAEAMEAMLVASTGAMLGSMQRGLDAGAESVAPGRNGSEASGRSTGRTEPARAFSAPQIPAPGRSWYRPPVQNPFLEMIDDVMKPWRTFVPDHSASARAAGQPDIFGAESAAEFMAAYHTGTGFTMAQISFPDEKSICLTIPAPWAVLSQR